jgi:ABC-type multidrug transport system permease subunit
MGNDDSWTPEEIARANERQREISEAAEQQSASRIEKRQKMPIMSILIRLLVGLIPFPLSFIAVPITPGFDGLGDVLGIFLLLMLSCLFSFCYLVLWACRVTLVRSFLYSAGIVGIVVLFFVMRT